MITRVSAATVGLLVYVGMLLAGYLAGNPFSTIIQRALCGLAGGLLLGYVAGRLGQVIVHEHFQRMVQADAEADEELPAAPAAGEPNGEDGEKKPEESSGANKEDRKNNREIGSPPAGRSVSTRAAEQAIQEVT